MKATGSLKMILVLLYKFSESQDSIIGYKLCEKLVEEGYDLLVTSVAKDKEKEAEIEAARRMTETLTGSVRIIEVEQELLDAPTPESFSNLQRTYYPEHLDPSAIEMILGTLPGTAQVAIELKNMFCCRLVLLAETKISTTKENLRAEVRRLASCSDEVWSMGSDIYRHYEELFREHKKRKLKKRKEITHKEIMLRPELRSNHLSFSNKRSKSEGHALMSVWCSKFPYHIQDTKKCTKGSTKPAFYAVEAALKRIQKEDLQGSTARIPWIIHGSEVKDYIAREESAPCQININAPGHLSSPHNILWDRCIAYIAPDVRDKSFNFLALVALWLGVPTLVSEESSVGKFLSGLTTPLKENPIVHLTGEFKTDRKVWLRKLKEDFFRKDACPRQWAMDLSEFLRTNDDLWRLDLSVLPEKHLESATLSNPMTDVVKVSHFAASSSAVPYPRPRTLNPIVTSEHINCCSGRVNVLLFGSLERHPGEEPLVTLKVILLSVPSKRRGSEKILREIQVCYTFPISNEMQLRKEMEIEIIAV